jgi:uncharacterized membrane protein
MDTRDWVVIILMAIIEIAGIVFIFKHPEIANFVTFGTMMGALISAYHWMVIRDSKQADAP